MILGAHPRSLFDCSAIGSVFHQYLGVEAVVRCVGPARRRSAANVELRVHCSLETGLIGRQLGLLVEKASRPTVDRDASVFL